MIAWEWFNVTLHEIINIRLSTKVDSNKAAIRIYKKRARVHSFNSCEFCSFASDLCVPPIQQNLYKTCKHAFSRPHETFNFRVQTLSSHTVWYVHSGVRSKWNWEYHSTTLPLYFCMKRLRATEKPCFLFCCPLLPSSDCESMSFWRLDMQVSYPPQMLDSIFKKMIFRWIC